MNTKDLKLLALVIVPLAAAPISLNVGYGGNETFCHYRNISLGDHLQKLHENLGEIYRSHICNLRAG